MSTHPIWRLTEDDAPAAGELLARAFAVDPIHCYALPGVTAVERAERLAPYFVTAVRYGCRFGEAWAVGAAPGELAGVGWWAPMPEAEFTDERIAAVNPTPFSPDLQAVLARVMELELPVDDILAGLLPRHHRHLAQLGVDPACQGQGFGRVLLAKFLTDAVADRVPLCLWTATPANVAFYRGAGMELVAEGAAEGDRPAWWAFGTPEPAPTEENSRG